jgi:Cu/Zn superoxide dismutase
MKRTLSLSSLTLLCLALILPASAAAPSTLTVNLQQQNGSGESGSATLTQTGSDVQVVVALDGAPASAQPMHIHTGTCSNLGGVAYPLTSVTGGKSTTTVKGVTIAQLLAKPTAINVHQSAAELQKYVACGNITAPSM